MRLHIASPFSTLSICRLMFLRFSHGDACLYPENPEEFDVSYSRLANRSATFRNFSSASSRFSMISAATSSGGGRESGSMWPSSLSQKISRFSLSRAASSS